MNAFLVRVIRQERVVRCRDIAKFCRNQPIAERLWRWRSRSQHVDAALTQEHKVAFGSEAVRPLPNHPDVRAQWCQIPALQRIATKQPYLRLQAEDHVVVAPRRKCGDCVSNDSLQCVGRSKRSLRVRLTSAGIPIQRIALSREVRNMLRPSLASQHDATLESCDQRATKRDESCRCVVDFINPVVQRVGHNVVELRPTNSSPTCVASVRRIVKRQSVSRGYTVYRVRSASAVVVIVQFDSGFSRRRNRGPVCNARIIKNASSAGRSAARILSRNFGPVSDVKLAFVLDPEQWTVAGKIKRLAASVVVSDFR